MPTNPQKRKRGRPSSSSKLGKAEILSIAIKVFAEKGFDGAQLKDIASRAGVSNSIIHYYFKDKEDLWKQAVEKLGQKLMEKFHEVVKNFESLAKDLKGITLLKAFNRQFIYFSAENPEFQRIIQQEMYSHSDRSKWLVQQILHPTHQYARKLVFMANDDIEVLKKFPVANFVTIMIGAATTFFTHAYQMEEQFGVSAIDPAEIERHADIVNALLFAQFE